MNSYFRKIFLFFFATILWSVGILFVHASSSVYNSLDQYCIAGCDYWGREWYEEYVQYKELDECSLQYTSGCRTSDDVNELINAQKRYVPGTEDFNSLSRQIYTCQQEVMQYEVSLGQYQQCTSLYQDYDYARYNCGENSHVLGSNTCACTDGYIWEDVHDPYNLTCVRECEEGAVRIDGQCVNFSSGTEGLLYVHPLHVQRPEFDPDMYSKLVIYESRIKSRRVYTEHIPVSIMQGYLLKSETSPECYLVDERGVLRWVENESIAMRLFGAYWQDAIVWVDDSLLGGYKVGASIMD